MEKMIVKVQVPRNVRMDQARELVSNEDRTVLVPTQLTGEILAAIGTRDRVFFYAGRHDERVEIFGEAPWQNW